jgi:hypothetical protein
MNVDVRVCVRGRNVLEHEAFAIDLDLVTDSEVCCGKASTGEGSKCKPANAPSGPRYKTGRSCGSDMRFLVFSCARTVAPAV